MRTQILLAITICSVGLPLVAADEGNPDCEDDQGLIGYGSTDFLRDTFAQNNAWVCEGEHWDGQDTVQPDQSPTCSPTTNLDPADLFVGYCAGADPNTMRGDDPLTPLGVRASSDGSQVYASTNIALVGRAAAYVGPGTIAVYLRDNTLGNLLATVVSAPRITQGYVDENDCSQSVYEYGAYHGNSQCGRDNTAITVEFPTLV